MTDAPPLLPEQLDALTYVHDHAHSGVTPERFRTHTGPAGHDLLEILLTYGLVKLNASGLVVTTAAGRNELRVEDAA